MFAIRSTILKAFKESPEYMERLRNCKNHEEIRRLFEEFCKEHSFKMKEINT